MLVFYLFMIDSEEDKEKFVILYQKWRNVMFYSARQILEDKGLAEDAVHDTFLYIAQNIHKIDDPNSLTTKSYLMMGVNSQAKKILRSRKEYVNSDFVDLRIDEQNETASVEDDFFDQYDEEALVKLIKELPENYRTPLLMQQTMGLSGKEIAKQLGLTYETVRQRLSRAKKMLKAKREKEPAI